VTLSKLWEVTCILSTLVPEKSENTESNLGFAGPNPLCQIFGSRYYNSWLCIITVCCFVHALLNMNKTICAHHLNNSWNIINLFLGKYQILSYNMTYSDILQMFHGWISHSLLCIYLVTLQLGFEIKYSIHI